MLSPEQEVPVAAAVVAVAAGDAVAEGAVDAAVAVVAVVAGGGGVVAVVGGGVAGDAAAHVGAFAAYPYGLHYPYQACLQRLASALCCACDSA